MPASLAPFSSFFSSLRCNASRILRSGARILGMSLPVRQPEFLRREEPLAGYRFGGYHPAMIGDVLNGRYQIRRKLGWGNYSTVWLAHDQKTNEYRSIKIVIGLASQGPESHELEFLQHVAKYDPGHPGYSRIIRLLDHFHHRGPNGNHLCLVTELLGESVLSLSMYTSRHNVHPIVTKSIARDVLQGLDYLHSSGIVHTDLKLDSFLVEIQNINAHASRLLGISSPEVYPKVRASDGRSITYTASEPLAIPYEDVENFRPLRIKIVDLGAACFESKTDKNITDQIQPPSLRAPEIWVGAGWGSKCDIWSLGLLVLEMLRGRPLVPPGDDGVEAGKVFFLVCFFGKFPKDLLEKGRYPEKYFKPDGSFVYDIPEAEGMLPMWTEYLDTLKKWLHPDEIRSLRSFLEAALSLRPEQRPTASQLLQHEWINSETCFLEGKR